MRINMVGAFIRNNPHGTEIAFHKGMQQYGGFEINTVDPSVSNQTYDYNADVTMVFKCLDDWSEVDKCEGKKVVYQPDDIRYTHIQELMKDARKHCDYALTYDLEAANIAKNDFGFLETERLLLTADPDLYKPMDDVKKQYDFCFVGNFSHPANHTSRRKMLEVLHKISKSIVFANAFYNIPAVVQLYNRTRVILNHVTDVGTGFGGGYGYQCRHFEAGMTRSCLLSNKVLNDDGSLTGFVIFDSEEHLLEQAAELLVNKQRRENYAKLLYDDIKERHMPVDRAEQLYKFFRRIGA